MDENKGTKGPGRGFEAAGGTRATERMGEDMEMLRRDLRQLREDVTSLGQHLLQTGRAGVRSARGQMDDAMGSVHERADELNDYVRTRVEENPLAAIGLVFGAGFLLGALWKR